MIGEHSINGAIVNMSKVNANICECILRIAAENKRESASIKLIMSTKFREKILSISWKLSLGTVDN